MSKSIKLKNNTYWDSESITHNRNTLKNKLNDIDNNISNKLPINNSLMKLNFTIKDQETGKVQIDHNCVYLLINAHTYKRSISLLTTYSQGLKQDVIFESDETSTPVVTMDSNYLTITTPRQGRVYLYKFIGCWCA